jgi:predicted PurR-regulated permease PerM
MADSTQLLTQSRPPVRVVALLWVIVIAIVVAFGFFASSLCITFLLAGFLAILVDPIPTYFERFHVPRLISTAVLIISGVLLVTLLIYVSYVRAAVMIDDMPEYAESPRGGQAAESEDRAGTKERWEHNFHSFAETRSGGKGQRNSRVAFLLDSRSGFGLGSCHRRRNRPISDVFHAGAQIPSL